MNRTFSNALTVQNRVLWSLCLREIHGQHGKFRIGYLWQVIRVGFSVSVFWWIREMGGFHAPQGLSTPIFLLMGFLPWFIFAEGISRVMEAVSTNKALLTFPQITPLDLYLSSALVVAATQLVVLLLYMAGINFAGYTTTIHHPMMLLLSLLGVTALSFGTGLMLAALNFYVPVIEKLVPMVLRVLFLTSGVFFSPSQMGSKFGDAIMWLPTANYIELLRAVFAGTGKPDAVSVEYIAGMTVTFLAVGLLLERYVRPRQVLT